MYWQDLYYKIRFKILVINGRQFCKTRILELCTSLLCKNYIFILKLYINAVQSTNFPPAKSEAVFKLFG